MEQEDGVQEKGELRVIDLAASWTDCRLVTQGTKREEQVFVQSIGLVFEQA